MGIQIACRCGHRYRATESNIDELCCPLCGRPARVAPPPASPTPVRQEPAAIEDVGPILVQVRRLGKDPNHVETKVWVPLAAETPLPVGPNAPKLRRRRRANWRLEIHWHECLLYPFRAWPPVVGLGLLLGGLAGTASLVLPIAPPLSADTWPNWLSGVGFGLLTISYAVGFLDCVASSAVVGEFNLVRVPGSDLGMHGLLTWLACFVFGPVIPALACWWYWLTWGDTEWLDKLIVAELGATAVGWWLLAGLSARERGKLSGALPDSVGALARRLGRGAGLAFVLAPALGFAIIWLGVAALEEVHTGLIFGLLQLGALGVAALFAATFLLRMLGLTCFNTRLAQRSAAVEEQEIMLS